MHQGVEVTFSINSAGTSKKQKYPPVDKQHYMGYYNKASHFGAFIWGVSSAG